MLNLPITRVHGSLSGKWEPPTADDSHSAAFHVREALALVAYLRARRNAGTSTSLGTSGSLEQRPAMPSPTTVRAAPLLGDQSTNTNNTLQGAAKGTLHGDGRVSDGISNLM